MDLLSEDRSPRDTVNYALAKERTSKSSENEQCTHTNKQRQPMVQPITIHQTTEQGTDPSNTKNRTNTGQPKMRPQFPARTLLPCQK